jgi:signal transduction histidine kinase
MKYILDQVFLASHRIEAVQQLMAPEAADRTRVDLAGVLQKSLNAVHAVFERLRVRPDIRLPPRLPELQADARQLEIVFVNLLKNAAEALESADGEARDLRITGRTRNGAVEVEIADSGPGVRPEDAPHIFQPHYSTKGANGSGMGLALSRRIVEAHGGSLRLENRYPKGATFVLSFPRIHGSEA